MMKFVGGNMCWGEHFRGYEIAFLIRPHRRHGWHS